MLSAALLLFANTLLFPCDSLGAAPFQNRCPLPRSGSGWTAMLRETRRPGMC